MRPEDFTEDSKADRREAAELAAFATRLGASLRADDRSQDHSALVDRVLAETTREDLGRGTDLRLVGRFLRERLAQSALLRFAAASLVVHLFAVPVVLAWVLLSERNPEVMLRFEPQPDARPFEEALPLDLEPLLGAPADGLDESLDSEPEVVDDGASGERR
ncbi:MAG: hypothetical protein ACI8QC_000064 [Planctomycetota bacterium]|jgi:hypothetical protein